MKLLNEATKEELEAALAKLNDPYKKFKDALDAGKRVRMCGFPWHIKEDDTFTWSNPPEEYEIEPEYCGYTEEQWQFVIDGKFLVQMHKMAMSLAEDCEVKLCLTDFKPKARNCFCNGVVEYMYCHIVREKGIKQPAFGRDVADNEPVVTHIKKQNIFRTNVARFVKWDDVDWFIEL